MENTINLSDVKKLIATAHATLCVVIHALDTKILVGEINRPEPLAEKKPRKRRTKKEMEVCQPKSSMRNPQPTDLTPSPMDFEKEYQAERHDPLNLPDADAGKAGEFWKKKREKKVIVPMVDK